MKENGKPEVRFPGFEDFWEQRKFSEITELAGQRNKEDKPYKTYSVTNDKGFVPQDEHFGERGYMKDADKKLYIIAPPQSFVYNPARINVGSIGYQNLDESVLVSSLYEVFKTSEDIDDRFLWHWFKSDEFSRKIQQYQEGSVRQYFYYDKLCGCKTLFPKIEEQRKIASFLDNVDDTITLHQRKIDNLKELKNGLLQKMFPQKGEKVPQVRFPGFTGDWEQRKFGDLGSVGMCKRIFKEQTTPDGEIPFYKIGTFGGEPDAFISRELFEEYKSKFQYPEVGDILISASGTIGRTVEYTGKDEYFQDSNIVWLKHDDKIDNSFLSCIYQTVKWAGIEGSTIKRLYNDNFMKTDFMMSSVPEQKKLGAFFAGLDNLITLHQRKLDDLKKLKRGLLQKMFV